MSKIAEALDTLRSELPADVSLVAVSKFHPVEAVMEAYEAGQRLFGESRVQELLQKIPQLPDDIQWHFIGHLQTNKVRQIIGKTRLIESVDSERLINLIDNESEKAGVVTDVLLQIHVACEETKFGFSPEEFLEYFAQGRHKMLRAVRIRGVMGMASNTTDKLRVRNDFQTIHKLYLEIAENVSEYGLEDFNIISMGMSGDWPLAVAEGSNMIRVGSSIFGLRQY